MTVTGTVERVVRNRTDYGSVFLAVTVSDPRRDGDIRLKYLGGFQPTPVKGDRVTIDGMPMVGGRTNIGAAHVIIHPAA